MARLGMAQWETAMPMQAGPPCALVLLAASKSLRLYTVEALREAARSQPCTYWTELICRLHSLKLFHS